MLKKRFAPQNHDFDIEFVILVSKIIFQKSKIVFSYSVRISFRDHKIQNRRRRKPGTPKSFFRAEILIFL